MLQKSPRNGGLFKGRFFGNNSQWTTPTAAELLSSGRATITCNQLSNICKISMSYTEFGLVMVRLAKVCIKNTDFINLKDPNCYNHRSISGLKKDLML